MSGRFSMKGLLRWCAEVAANSLAICVGYTAGATLMAIASTVAPPILDSVHAQFVTNDEEHACVAAISALALPETDAEACEPLVFDQQAACLVFDASRLTVFDVGPVYRNANDETLDYPGPQIHVPLFDGRWPEHALRGQLHPRLYQTLQARAEHAKTRAALSSDADHFGGRILLAIDEHVPFETQRQAMYTSGQAQFGDFNFVHRKGDALCVMPSLLPQIGPPSSTP
jgi:hypothetical protein